MTRMRPEDLRINTSFAAIYTSSWRYLPLYFKIPSRYISLHFYLHYGIVPFHNTISVDFRLSSKKNIFSMIFAHISKNYAIILEF